jgi:hypothetical protein
MEPYPDRASLIVHQGLELEVGEADLKLLERRHYKDGDTTRPREIFSAIRPRP